MTEPTGTIYDQMTAAVQRVAEARERRAADKSRLDFAQAEFNAQHGPLLDSLNASGAAVAEAEATAKALAEAHFTVTGEKKPVPGIEVKERTKYDLTDPDAALAWAKLTGLCLVPESVDVKALEKVAKATPLPFVTARTEPMVTLASDLTAALAKEPA